MVSHRRPVLAVRRFGPKPSPKRMEAMASVQLYPSRVRRVVAAPKAPPVSETRR